MTIITRQVCSVCVKKRVMVYLSGICLTVPEGAVPKGCSEDFFVAVSRDDKDRPKLTGMSTVKSFTSFEDGLLDSSAIRRKSL